MQILPIIALVVLGALAIRRMGKDSKASSVKNVEKPKWVGSKNPNVSPELSKAATKAVKELFSKKVTKKVSNKKAKTKKAVKKKK